MQGVATARPTAEIDPTVLDAIEQRYHLRHRDDVLYTLEKFPALIDPLLEAPEKIRSYFPDAPLVLDYFDEMGTPDGEELTIRIVSTLGLEETMKRMDDLDDEWGYDVLHRTDGRLYTDMVYLCNSTGNNT